MNKKTHPPAVPTSGTDRTASSRIAPHHLASGNARDWLTSDDTMHTLARDTLVIMSGPCLTFGECSFPQRAADALRTATIARLNLHKNHYLTIKLHSCCSRIVQMTTTCTTHCTTSVRTPYIRGASSFMEAIRGLRSLEVRRRQILINYPYEVTFT